ncbi:nitric oxide reductase activation protein NorD [Ancylobacter sp. IITR112]|uniref:nitric oxide reductase activation protein NorD n=1 Tax=Ancylobacter sp. IITR112 TaxID=3138073 RepID=UPI00352A7E55
MNPPATRLPATSPPAMDSVVDEAAAARLARLLAPREALAGVFRETQARLARRHGAAALGEWAEGALALLAVNAGAAALLAYARASLDLSPRLSPAALGETGRAAAALCRAAGGQATIASLNALVVLAPRLPDEDARALWWRALLTLAQAAPDCVEPVAAQARRLVRPGHVAAFEGFIAAGLKAAGRDRARQRAFFALEDPLALSLLARIGAGPGFAEMEMELKRLLAALWGEQAPLQPLPPAGEAVPARANLAGPVIRLPEVFPGVEGEAARLLYRAAALHAGAHRVFGGPPFPINKFKPVQMALAGLVEDARVETLAMMRYPGLRRLWGGYHRASPEDGPTLAALLARLARGLFDPGYADPDALVGKAQALFAAARERLDDPALSLDIGTRLANDVGQRRLRFDARGHVVEPAYRDDGLGLWDFSAHDPEPGAEVPLIVQAARAARRHGEDGPSEGAPAPAAAGRARPAPPQGVGAVIATYPEWDAQAGLERPDWVSVRALAPVAGDGVALRRALEAAGPARARIARLVKAAKLGRATRLKRQAEGADLDLDAVIEAAIARRAGAVPDLNVFRATALTQRDLAVLVLIDMSHSTRARLADGRSVLEVEKLAVAMLGEALEALGDRFALLAFASNGRGEVGLCEVKGVGEAYDGAAIARLAGLSSGLSTRLGAALRHAGAEISRIRAFRRLILVLSDGEPADIDTPAADLVEDARRAVRQLRGQGIDTFGVTLDPAGVGAAPLIFGAANAMPVRRLEELPLRLSELYFRLARR